MSGVTHDSGLLLVSATPRLGQALTEAAALGVAAAVHARSGAALLIDLAGAGVARGTILAAEPARRLASSATWQDSGASTAARGRLALVLAGGEADPARLLELSEDCGMPRVVHAGPERFRDLMSEVSAGSGAALLRSDGPADDRLAAALSIELRRAGVRHRIWRQGLGAVGGRRARAGLDPGGEASRRSQRAAAALIGRPGPVARRAPLGAARRLLANGESGQTLVAVVGLVVVLAVFALILAAIGGAVTGKGRAQRAADLAALSAARSMRDDYERLFLPRLGSDGRPDPRRLSKSAYLDRAGRAAVEAASRNGLAPESLRVSFPDRGEPAPLRVEVRARPRIESEGLSSRERTEVAATAVAAPAPAATAAPAEMASGGGYAGPLAYRQGKPMRPDVAAAFDRMSRAAAAAGHALVVNSGFRSDAEQAELFAANPDPRWVAPPGKSLHRCATELDLGPATAYGWLADHAPRFGFVRRYSWEAWHFGYADGPPPCSKAADRAPGPSGDGRAAAVGLPGFVPGFARRPLQRAASAHGVSATLLAAQLQAESNFDPSAVSPAGAQGIAQFMPATAAAYGLDDPFDVAAAIDAQARLMSDLLAQFGSPALALAAYNAGPAPVSACSCVPPYPETQSYVARILALLKGAGQLPGVRAGSLLEVRLVG